jgi:hypothetical protein
MVAVGAAVVGFAVPGGAGADPSRPGDLPVPARSAVDHDPGDPAPPGGVPDRWRSPDVHGDVPDADAITTPAVAPPVDGPQRSAGRAVASQVTAANWVPFVGSHWVACTRSNPSPGGVCAHHHPYIGAVDFAMPVGAPVHASGPGEVVYVNDTCELGHTSCEGGAGRWVGVAHPDGRVSRYMHLEVVAVTTGQAISRGQYLGTGGETGNAVIPHLHYDEQKPLWTRTEMGELFACHGNTFVRYPQAAGYDHWDDVPYGTVVRNDGTGCAGDLFFDVGALSPFRAEIAWAVTGGVTTGFADGTFKPTGAVTRQAVAAWLHRLGGAPAGPFDDHGFVDVTAHNPFRVPIGWMADTGRATGFADGTFRPIDCVTRQAMVAFLHRELDGAISAPAPHAGFVDVGAGHPFAAEIDWAAQRGLVNGFDDGTFRPGDCVSRQAAAAFLFRGFT